MSCLAVRCAALFFLCAVAAQADFITCSVNGVSQTFSPVGIGFPGQSTPCPGVTFGYNLNASVGPESFARALGIAQYSLNTVGSTANLGLDFEFERSSTGVFVVLGPAPGPGFLRVTATFSHDSDGLGAGAINVFTSIQPSPCPGNLVGQVCDLPITFGQPFEVTATARVSGHITSLPDTFRYGERDEYRDLEFSKVLDANKQPIADARVTAVNVVPEPSPALLLMGGGALLWKLGRQRRRSH